MRHPRLLLGAALTPLLLMQGAHAYTLEQFWHQACSHDPRIQVYRRQLEVASTAQPLALAALLPQITAGANVQFATEYTQEPYNSVQPDTALLEENSRTRTESWSVQLQQALFNWSALQDYQASGDQVAAAAATYQEAMQNLEKQATAAYVQWLLADANVRSLQEAEQGFARQALTAKARYQAGTTGILGADEAQVALRQIQAQLADARAQWQVARQKLQQFTGTPAPDRAPTLPQKIRLSWSTLTLWKKAATQHNPALAAANDQLAAAQKSVSAAWGGFLPSISLVFAHQWQSQHGTLGYRLGSLSADNLPNPYRNTESSAMVELSWSIFSGGSQQATLHKARYQQEENFQLLLATERSVEKQLSADFADLNGAGQQSALYRRALLVARHASAAAEDGVRVGLVTENNAIIDRQNVLTVRNALNSANAAVVTNYASLAATAGVLTPIRIRQLSVALSPLRESSHESSPIKS